MSRKKPIRNSRRKFSLEQLEQRTLLAVNLTTIDDIAVPESKTYQVPIDTDLTGADAGEQIAITATSNNASLHVTVAQQDVTLVINVTIDGVPQDPLEIQLFSDLAPLTVAAISQLVQDGFYTNREFHRVIPDFVAQFGLDQAGGFPTDLDAIIDEFNALLTFVGIGQFAMAKVSEDDSGTGQAFLTADNLSVTGTTPPQHLNFEHTIFGQLTRGFNTLAAILAVGSAGGTTSQDVIITSAQIVNRNDTGVVRVRARPGFTGTGQVTVDVSSPGGGSAQQVFTVTAVADSVNDRAFLGATSDLNTLTGQPVSFDLNAFDLESDDTLTFAVRDADDFDQPPSDVEVEIGPVEINHSLFSQLLVDAGVTLTGSSGDSDVIAQLAEFDGEAGALFTDGVTTEPTWTFPDGSQFEGVLTLQQISDRSGVLVAQTVTVTLTPDESISSGEIELLVGVSDGQHGTDVLGFDTNAVTLTVDFFNLQPEAISQNVKLKNQNSVLITLAGNDGDATVDQNLTFEIVQNPVGGTLSNFNAATGKVRYTRNAGFTGTDRFFFRVRDDGGVANGATDTSNRAPVTLISNAVAGEAVLRDSELRVFGNGQDNDIRITPFRGDDTLIDVVIDELFAGTFAKENIEGITMRGKGGNDTMSVPNSLDIPVTMLGGPGNDQLKGGPANDNLIGNSGRDLILGKDGDDEILGGSGLDEIFGGKGNDEIDGGGDADVIQGQGGNDQLRGGRGNDEISGDAGNDQILGGDGRDILHGSAGRDNINGQQGVDEIYGGSGGDFLKGGAGADKIKGESGSDILVGGGGRNTLEGGNGNDFINADGAEPDLVMGGRGDDVLNREGGDDTLYGGPGSDLFGPIDLNNRSDFVEGVDENALSPIRAGEFGGENRDPEHESQLGGDFRSDHLLGERTDLRDGAPDVEDRTHVNSPTPIDYSDFSNPPSYGPHRPFNPGTTPRPTGFYSVAQDDTQLVHNLEHGHVWIAFDPDLAEPFDRFRLEVLGDMYTGFGGVVITPRTTNDDAFALVSWAHLETLDQLNISTIIDFILTNRGHAPEGFIPD